MKYLIIIVFFYLTSFVYSQSTVNVVYKINELRLISNKWPLTGKPNISDSIFKEDYQLSDSIVFFLTNKKKCIDNIFNSNILLIESGFMEIVHLNKNKLLIKAYENKKRK